MASARGLCMQHVSTKLQRNTPTHVRAFPPTTAFNASVRRRISANSLPTTLQPAFWRSLMPKSWRKDSEPHIARPVRDSSKEWNPATFFIMIFLLIGSQGIQMVSLQNNFDRFSTHTETKLALLRDVVKRVHNGEDVDVEGMMGTGDPAKEKEWEEVMRELEQEDNRIRKQRKRRKSAPQQDEQSLDSSTSSPAPG